MTRKTEPKKDDPEQSKRFIAMAREVEVNEDPQSFDRAFGKIIKAPRDRAPEKIGPRRQGPKTDP